MKAQVLINHKFYIDCYIIIQKVQELKNVADYLRAYLITNACFGLKTDSFSSVLYLSPSLSKYWFISHVSLGLWHGRIFY